MSALVLDSSCAVAIISPDEHNEVVLALLDRIIEHGAFAPSLWLYETANATRFKWAKDDIVASTAREAIEKLHALPVEIVDMEPAVIRGGVLALAQKHGLTIYDASYLHLAMMLSLPLATFDKQLIAAAPAEGVDLVTSDWTMRTSDTDILIVPGWSGSGPDHWQSRWEAKLPTARRVEQEDWYKPTRDGWASRIVAAVRAATRPVVIVAHSAGVSAVAHAAAHLKPHEVTGAFLVAPASERAKRAIPGMADDFASIPLRPLPFRSVLIASATDPYCTPDEAKALAKAWGSEFVDAGDSGHLNTESGHGPWPDGLLRFAGFMKSLTAV